MSVEPNETCAWTVVDSPVLDDSSDCCVLWELEDEVDVLCDELELYDDDKVDIDDEDEPDKDIPADLLLEPDDPDDV
jgi:hypothetical protein